MTTPIDGVPYEADMQAPGDVSFGLTKYDSGFAIPSPTTKGTDADLEPNIEPMPYTEWSELDYEIGGEPGATNRNAYAINGIENTWDEHSFRGDHPLVPQRVPFGAYGDVGDSDDYSVQYAQAIAANAYPDVTQEESWDEISQGF